MISLAFLRDNKEQVVRALKVKYFDASELADQILVLDQEKRMVQKQLEDNLAKGNLLAKEIGQLFKEGKKDEAEAKKNETVVLKEQAKVLQEEMSAMDKELQALLVLLPNIPHQSVPQGKTAEDNEVITQGGDAAIEQKGGLPHWELAKQYDLIDFETGVKITGAGFPLYKGKGAKLQRALINFFLDQAMEQGYTEFEPPIIVNEDTAYATGQLPDKEGQMYFAEKDNLYLIPTAEVPLTNIYRDVILKESDFPIKLTAYTPCFRREAGSYGKDVRGLNRLHQFDKVEVVQIEHPERSYETLEKMKDYAVSLLDKLGLRYRVIKLCGGDMSFASAMTYDLEVYSSAQQRWLEVSSVSNFETFQSNRLMLRFKGQDGKTRLAHTLNGSALALPRIVAAILETYQSAEGIHIPEALQPYTGFKLIN